MPLQSFTGVYGSDRETTARSNVTFSSTTIAAASTIGVYTTTPVQFEPDAWEQTLDRYLSFDPQRMYLTHYGCVENVAQLAGELRQGLRDYQSLARKAPTGDARHQALTAALLAHSLNALRQKRSPATETFARDWLALDMDLNAQGLEVWLDKAG